MLAATSLAIFIVPVLFFVITKVAYGKEKLAELEKNYKPEEHETHPPAAPAEES